VLLAIGYHFLSWLGLGDVPQPKRGVELNRSQIAILREEYIDKTQTKNPF